jgi:protein-S-isoprenylcysteine O-methyltransferase Ste14
MSISDSMSGPKKDSPGVIAFPPLVFAGSLALGFLVQFFVPLHLFASPPPKWIGGVVALASAVLAKWGETVMRRAGTNIKPSQPTTAIVQTGPFRFSRNPLYISLTLFYLGVCLMFNALWPLLLLPPLLVVVQRGIIYREERYLEAKFGEEYRDYRRRVRRWL